MEEAARRLGALCVLDDRGREVLALDREWRALLPDQRVSQLENRRTVQQSWPLMRDL